MGTHGSCCPGHCLSTDLPTTFPGSQRSACPCAFATADYCEGLSPANLPRGPQDAGGAHGTTAAAALGHSYSTDHHGASSQHGATCAACAGSKCSGCHPSHPSPFFHIRARGYSWGIKGELLQLRRGPTVCQGTHSWVSNANLACHLGAWAAGKGAHCAAVSLSLALLATQPVAPPKSLKHCLRYPAFNADVRGASDREHCSGHQHCGVPQVPTHINLSPRDWQGNT